MVEQMLDGDRIAGRQRDSGQQGADPVGQCEPSLGRELVEQRGGHDLADRADLEQRFVAIGEPRVAIGEAEIEHSSLKPSGMVSPSVSPGSAKRRMCASANALIAAIAGPCAAAAARTRGPEAGAQRALSAPAVKPRLVRSIPGNSLCSPR